MANNTSNFQTTQTFLIECSRADSLIDTKETADFNSKWSNATNFNLKRGDVVSVEAITLAAKNASGAGTVEFSGDKVFIDGTEKDYCDNKVLLEVMFYMNNNNTYSCGMPFNHPEGSFNNQAANANTPVLRDFGTNYYEGLPCSFNSSGYLSQAVYNGVVNSTVDPTISYTIFQYNIGTPAIPNFVSNVPIANPPTPISSVVLTTSLDTPPANTLPAGFGAYTRGDVNNVNEICNVLPGNNIAIKTGANVDDFIIFEPEVDTIRNQSVGGANTGRIELVFTSAISATGVNFTQYLSLAIDPSERGGSTEMGNIHYSNIDQTGMSGPGSYRRHEKILNLAANCFAVPQAALPSADRHKFFPTSTYGGGTGNATPAYDYDNNKQGFRSGNIREECNGKPYIWTRNDYFGMGAVKRNCKGFFPKLMPMTAFILLEANELFTDLTTLANTINDKLHEALAPFDNDISVMDNYMTNKVVEPNPQFKSSSVVPVGNAFGFYPSVIYNSSTYFWKSVYGALWTDILPVKYGGLTKIQPANFQAGRDFIDEGIGRIQQDISPNVNDNVYLTDMVEFNSYPKEGRIGNYIYGNMGYKEIYKMMFGDRLMRLDCYNMNTTAFEGSVLPSIGNRNIGRPVMINTRLQIRTEQVPLPNVAVFSTLTQLRRFQTIFTNMKFPTYTIDANGNKVLNYDPQIWKDLAESIRDYEIYSNKDPATSKTTYANQKLDPPGWSCSLDCGISDDYDSVFTQSKTTNITPQEPAWMRQVPPNASINNSTAYGTGISNVAPTTAGFREIISPAFSQAYFGDDATSFSWADNWNAYRGIGKLNVMTRYDSKWRESSKEFSHVVAGQTDPSLKLIIDTDALTEELSYLDVELMERLNLPFVPGEYTNSDGVKLYVCGWRCAEDYGEDFNKFNTSTFQLGCLCWGLPLGVSNSLLDNHAICPLNGDQNNSINPIKEQASPNPTIQPYRAYIENQTPYVVIGANNPTFQYNSNKNRFEFLNLQTDNLLSSLNTSANSPSTNPQIGEKCGIIAGQQRDAVFNIPNPQTRATSANNYTDPIRNQGIRAEIGGVSIFKIHLCPPDYQVPENINPVNYWNNSTLEKTEENRQKIIESCIEADDENWEGCLLSRLGFDVEDFIPRYGRQYNRFSPDTYNNPNPNIIPNSTKPLILCNDLDPVINPALNLYFKFPLPGSGDTPNGVPKFLHGFNQSQEAIVALQSQPLTASNSPLLTNSSFFLIYSDIVGERNYQSGSTPLPCVFYAMKNYSNGGYLYAYGSNYNIMVNQDRLLSQINTEIRNPTDGKLAKLSPNSTIIYKIQRNAIVPNPEIDVFGKATVEQKQPDPNKEELDKIFNEEKKIVAAVGGSVPSSSGIRVAGTGGMAADRMRLRIKQNIGEGTRTDDIQGPSSGTPSQALSLFMRQSEAGDSRVEEETKNRDEIPVELNNRAMRLAIQTILNKTPVPLGTMTRNDFRGLRKTLVSLFQTILNGDINLDMESRWTQSGEDAEDFLEELLDDIGEVSIGARGQRLFSRRNQPLRTSQQGVVYATPDGLNEITAILTDVFEGRLTDENAAEYLSDTLLNGGVLLERPEVVDSRGRGRGRDEGAPITYRSFNIAQGVEVDEVSGGRQSIAQPLYNPDSVSRTLGESLRETVREIEGGRDDGPVIEEYGGGGGMSKEQDSKQPSSESTEAFSSGRQTSSMRSNESKNQGPTTPPPSPPSSAKKAPAPPPAQRRGDGDGKDDL